MVGKRIPLVTSDDVARAATAGSCTLAQFLAYDDGLDGELADTLWSILFEAGGQVFTVGEVTSLMLAPIPSRGFADKSALSQWIATTLRPYRIGIEARSHGAA